MKKVYYEWDLETWDAEDGDILDHHHADRLRDLPTPSTPLERLVLVRNEGNEVEGITDRLWAYVDNESRMLPKFFEQGAGMETTVLVPQRFHREIAREMAR